MCLGIPSAGFTHLSVGTSLGAPEAARGRRLNYVSVMVVALVLLYVLAALLPIAGFSRLLHRANRELKRLDRMVEERGSARVMMADFDAEYGGDVREPARAQRRDVGWDTALVGLGLIAGATASILSLFV